MLEVWTIQISKWRQLVGTDIILLDTTAMNKPNSIFSPTWEIVRGIKSGKITETQYTETYLQLLRFNYLNRRDEFKEAISRPKIAIGCFCPSGQFCHRHLLANWLVRMHEHKNKPIINHGEFQ